MPLAWQRDETEAPGNPGAFLHAAGDPPAVELRLWPHRSLAPQGFVAFVGLTAGLLALPLIGMLGTPVLWAVLPFAGLAVWGLWTALRRNAADAAALREELRLWRDRVEIVRQAPGRPRQEWAANPHWVRVTLHEEGGPVEQYLTLHGGGREVELGAFLSPDERVALAAALRARLAALR
jgi:uncharacterized membrane protein